MNVISCISYTSMFMSLLIDHVLCKEVKKPLEWCAPFVIDKPVADIPNHCTSFFDNILEIFLWKGIYCSTHYKSVTNSFIILLVLTPLKYILLERHWQIDVPS